MSKSKATEPGVFILESNTLADERRRRREGEALVEILGLLGRKTEYRYFRTKQELTPLLGEFLRSRLRYLHLSCHGNPEGFGLTLGSVRFSEFGQVARPYLGNRRLFVSACDAVHEKLALALFPLCELYSLAGPAEDILYGDAAVAWAAFYNLTFRSGARVLKNSEVEAALKRVCRAFDLRFHAFFRRGPKSGRFRKVAIGPK
jgi:hypothetical protein